ncbi:ATP-binding cassette domain-containing protein [Cytophagaceae bacterium YF14B1]|uniref:ATP-binding cassette domain-containing protein n=1 Tax=Xanthocytophaga flava TaxID=3048013 RepID=A0AAE3U8N9_9BACT|nr:ATP-binding cassette domain-containing protein [Xanthocytophaga flavus]MDJ1481383.1 ATP-binding cassette domain-containing protein [Xanthocytophaga flavus]
MFQLTGIRYNYTTTHTLSFPDWTAAQGDRWLLTGVSGSGKTTLLHMLAGLRQPTQGTAIIAGTNLYTLSGNKADQFRGQNIGLVLQKPHLLSVLTVEENLLLTQYMAGLPQNKQRIAEVLSILSVLEKRKSMPHQLSQGQAQRISIARAVLNLPKLILADEPTSSLDDVNCMRVLDLLETQAAACGATLVIATHDARVKNRIANHLHLESVQTVLGTL